MLEQKKVLTSNTLEECKYQIKKTKLGSLINDELETSLSAESNSESDHESDNE